MIAEILEEIKQVEKEAEGIINEAIENGRTLVENAKKEAGEIIEKTKEDSAEKAGEIIEKARKDSEIKANEIEQKTKREIEELKEKGRKNLGKAVEVIIKSVVGM